MSSEFKNTDIEAYWIMIKKLRVPIYRLLQGSGKYVKHIKIFSVKDIDSIAISKLIRQAVRYERA